MSTLIPVQSLESPAISDWIPSPLYRMSLEKYEAMVESGAFSDHDRFHLINGFLVEKMTRALDKAIPPGWHVRSAKPVRLPPNSKPEPDRSVVRGSIRDYSERSPGPEDIGLILEVSVSSLAQDRQQAGVYAASGIPYYWIVNVAERKVEVYFDPAPTAYKFRSDYAVGEKVSLFIGGISVAEIPVSDLLP
jgi:Uma2 family endonuclease